MRATAPRLPAGAQTGSGDEVAAALSVVVATGALLDVYSHVVRDEPEGFATPWHALLYTAAAALSYWVLRRGLIEGDELYRAAWPGVALLWVAAPADAIWHAAFGSETGTAASISPPHLGLYLGGTVMSAVPLRRALAERRGQPMTWPVALNIGALLGGTAIPLHRLSVYDTLDTATSGTGSRAADAALLGSTLVAAVTMAGVLVAGLIVFRARPGQLAAMLALTTGLSVLGSGLERSYLLGAAGLAAVAGEAVASRTRVGAVGVQAAFSVVAAVHWLAVVASVQAVEGLAWSFELWSGAVALAVMASVVVGVCAAVLKGGDHCSP
jgi:hypothetical protein